MISKKFIILIIGLVILIPAIAYFDTIQFKRQPLDVYLILTAVEIGCFIGGLIAGRLFGKAGW